VNKSVKTLGLALLLVLLLALAARFFLAALETGTGPTADPQGTIRKVEKDIKKATDKQSEAIQRAAEADAAPAPQPEE
jgi:apolipoprotein N-acyltransferase